MSHYYEPFTVEVAEGDRPYEESAVASVTPLGDGDGWSVTMESGWSVAVPAIRIESYGRALREPVEPKVGDRVALYGRGVGYDIEGIVVNDAVVYYRTQEMRDAHRRRWLEDLDARRDREFVLLREEMDKEYAALPEFFQARIDRFRAESPEFRRESERYEVFCLTEAVKIADYFAEEAPDDPSGSLRAMVESGSGAAWDALRAAEVVSDGHSGNTFGGALKMADALLRHRAGEDVRA